MNDALWTVSTVGNRATVRAGDDGRYSIKSLRPGDYFVAAVERVEMPQTSDPEFLKTLVAGATRVTISEGTRSVDLRIIER